MNTIVEIEDALDGTLYRYSLSPWETLKSIEGQIIREKPHLVDLDKKLYYEGKPIGLFAPIEQIMARSKEGETLHLKLVEKPGKNREAQLQDESGTTGSTIPITVRLVKDDTKYNFSVDPNKITVDDFKGMLEKATGPSFISGLAKDTMLLYLRDETFSSPLQELELQQALKGKTKLFLDCYNDNRTIQFNVKIKKKFSICPLETFDMQLESHTQAHVLFELIISRMKESSNPKVIAGANCGAESIVVLLKGEKYTESKRRAFLKRNGKPIEKKCLHFLNLKDLEKVTLYV